jgi:hypothetical protein
MVAFGALAIRQHPVNTAATRGDEPFGSISVWTELGVVILSFRWRGWGESEWKSIEQRVPITWSTCHFGGLRPWFRCAVHSNGRYCGRRVAKLYAVGKLFACRHCCGLAYESQQEPMGQRGLGKAQKIRAAEKRESKTPPCTGCPPRENGEGVVIGSSATS